MNGRRRIGIAGRLGRLHHDEGGLVVVLFVLIGLVFALLIGLNWNVGRVISGKQRAQAAADAAALAAATWQARALNMVTASNMLILRNASAQVSARAVEIVLQKVPERWDQALRDCGDEPDGPCFTHTLNRILDIEAGPYIDFAVRSGGPAGVALSDGVFTRRIEELHEFQRRFVEGIPAVVEDQRILVEEFHDASIVLAVPGRTDGRITPPVRPGDAASFERMLRERRRRSDGLIITPEGREILEMIRGFDEVGDGLQIWVEAEEAAIIEVSAAYGTMHYVLATQIGLDEFGPSTEGREDFSVLATAQIDSIRGRNFLFDGFFTYNVGPADSVFGAAQAEVFNGYDEVLAKRNRLAAWPFRVWTLWGWNWQPRLTNSALAGLTVETDEATRLMWGEAGVGEGVYDSIGFGLQH